MADTDYCTNVIDHGACLGIDVEVTRRDPYIWDSRWLLSRGANLEEPQAHPRIDSELEVFMASGRALTRATLAAHRLGHAVINDTRRFSEILWSDCDVPTYWTRTASCS
ncbi:hypothetical protein ABZ252_26305 [Streptomyces sp. NPDC006175]|uniref:hypothetical protein n=1 Tax=unclassified Streptomyces TaxID=2593676 RepID=UPI0033AEF29C